MQSVVRSSLVGLLALAGLAACGDKVNVIQPTSTPASTVVHSVTVTPNSVPSLAVGASVTLSASVDAEAGVTVRTVSWSSSDATVASVDAASGKVTGNKAGTVTITAAATADPNVKGAALVTVAGGAGANPVVTISSINATNAQGQSVPANLAGAAGQLDVILNVEANGQALRSISATLKCGTDSITQTQTISTNVSALDASEAAAPVIFSFNTAAFTVNQLGAALVALHNGQCTVSATATTTTSQSATNTTSLTLLNPDGVLLANSFAPITNAEGVTQPTSATDAGGLPWRSGSLTVTATPVLYSTRTISSVSITVPGAQVPTQTITAAPFSATWSGSSTSGSAPTVTGKTLVTACTPLVGLPPANGCEVNNSTPLGITPTIIVLDAAGNDLGLPVLNAGIPGQSTFRLDNTAPQPGTSFLIPVRQIGWVNAAYTFTGVGGASFVAGAGTTNYVACGDGTQTAGVNGCVAQVGVATLGANGSIVTSTAAAGASGITGLTTFTYYYIPAANYAAASATNGTSTSATACSTTGWTKIATGGDIPASATNTAYVIRVFETDKLGNARCTDLGATANLTNSGVFARGLFGVDKVAPVASFVVAGDPSCAPGGCVQDLAKITANPTGAFVVGYSDDASGFSISPLSTKLTRLAIDPATGVASTVNTAFGCPIGFANGACGTASTAGTIAADAGGPNGLTSGIDGYYTFTGQIVDLARNAGTTLTRQVVVDRAVPLMGGIAVPATIVGGTTASFATSATDNLDLVGTDYTLTYPITPTGAAVALNIRATGNAIGVAFDNVLTTAASFSLAVPSFMRTVASTAAGGLPQANGVLPSQIAVRVYDAAGNASLPGVAVINPANVATTTPPITNYAAAQPNGATFTNTGFQVANGVTSITNCPATGTCTPVNPTTVTLVATAQGTEGAAFQFLNPFSSINFYYLDTGYAGATGQWLLIGTAIAPTVTDNSTQTIRTFTWTLTAPFDPPAALGAAALNVIAVGVNTLGDGLVSGQNANITMTIP
jgi:hypothetical protein